MVSILLAGLAMLPVRQPIERDATVRVSYVGSMNLDGHTRFNEELHFVTPVTLSYDREAGQFIVSNKTGTTADTYGAGEAHQVGDSIPGYGIPYVHQILSTVKEAGVQWNFNLKENKYVCDGADVAASGVVKVRSRTGGDALEFDQGDLNMTVMSTGRVVAGPDVKQELVFGKALVEGLMSGELRDGNLVGGVNVEGQNEVRMSIRVQITTGKFLCAGKPSGPEWTGKYPDLRDPATLKFGFKSSVERFLTALQEAGAEVSIGSCLRPRERGFLMHQAWLIAREGLDPKEAPTPPEIGICWAHPRGSGVDMEASKAAAEAMVRAYHMRHDAAEESNHFGGQAIDMTITWAGDLRIKDANGNLVTITSGPRTGGRSVDNAGNAYPAGSPEITGNLDLHRVGATYGVIKLVSATNPDPPHWSYNGK